MTATVVVLAAISATRVAWATMVADVAAAVDSIDVARLHRVAEVAMIDVVHRDVAHRRRVAAEVAIGMTVAMEVIAVEEEEPMQIVVLTGGQQIRDQGQHRRVAAEIRRRDEETEEIRKTTRALNQLLAKMTAGQPSRSKLSRKQPTYSIPLKKLIDQNTILNSTFIEL